MICATSSACSACFFFLARGEAGVRGSTGTHVGREGPPFHLTFEQNVQSVIAVWQGVAAAATVGGIECYLSIDMHKQTH